MNFPAQVECLNLARITAASIRIASGSFGQNLNLHSGLARASGSFCQRALFTDARIRLDSTCKSRIPSLPFPAPTSAARKRRVKAATASRATARSYVPILF
jgi:hypothetical protein